MRKLEFKHSAGRCIICGCSRLKRIDAEAYDTDEKKVVRIVECEKCKFAWQNPVTRSLGDSIIFFESAYEDAGRTGSSYFDVQTKQEIAKMEFGFVEQLPIRNTCKKLLDVGGGSGIFAEVAAAHGWHATIIDPALHVPKKSTPQEAEYIKGTIDDIPATSKYDVITLWDVIEHVEDPAALISSCMKNLRKSGWLVIETGNYKSSARVYGGRKHWIYQLDHRWYFSPDSIECMLCSMGFSDFVYADRVLRPGWSGTTGYSGPSLTEQIKYSLNNPFRMKENISRYRELMMAKHWRMSGLDIFTVACRLS